MQEGKFCKGCCQDGADRTLLESVCKLAREIVWDKSCIGNLICNKTGEWTGRQQIDKVCQKGRSDDCESGEGRKIDWQISNIEVGGYASTELYHQDILDNLPRVYERMEHIKIFNVDVLDLLKCYVDNEKVFAFLALPYRHDLRGKDANKIYKCELLEIQQIKGNAKR